MNICVVSKCLQHCASSPVVVVSQHYVANVFEEHIIDGNSALLKCSVPSFVSEDVSVAGWVSSKGDGYTSAGSLGIYYVLAAGDTLLCNNLIYEQSSILYSLKGLFLCVCGGGQRVCWPQKVVLSKKNATKLC